MTTQSCFPKLLLEKNPRLAEGGKGRRKRIFLDISSRINLVLPQPLSHHVGGVGLPAHMF